MLKPTSLQFIQGLQGLGFLGLEVNPGSFEEGVGGENHSALQRHHFGGSSPGQFAALSNPDLALAGIYCIGPLGDILSVEGDEVLYNGEVAARADLGLAPQLGMTLEGDWVAAGNGRVVKSGTVYSAPGVDSVALSSHHWLAYGPGGVAVDGKPLAGRLPYQRIAPGSGAQGHINAAGDYLVVGSRMTVFNGEKFTLRNLGSDFASALGGGGDWVVATPRKVYHNGEEIREGVFRLRLGQDPQVAASDTGSWIAAGSDDLVVG